jgi:hypothetical protein
LAVEPQDVGRAVEGAEHDGEPPVGPEVGGGLGAAAGAVEIGDRMLVDDRERVRPARRNVDARAWRRGSGEEDALPGDEVAMAGVDARELLAHGEGLLTGLRRCKSNRRRGLTTLAPRGPTAICEKAMPNFRFRLAKNPDPSQISLNRTAIWRVCIPEMAACRLRR